MDKGTIMRVGIVGQGYVGTAVKTVFEKHYKVNTFDLNKCGALEKIRTPDP